MFGNHADNGGTMSDKTHVAGQLAIALTEIDRLRAALRAVANDPETPDDVAAYARHTCQISVGIIRCQWSSVPKT
jgi:hypothetical protein